MPTQVLQALHGGDHPDLLRALAEGVSLVSRCYYNREGWRGSSGIRSIVAAADEPSAEGGGRAAATEKATALLQASAGQDQAPHSQAVPETRRLIINIQRIRN